MGANQAKKVRSGNWKEIHFVEGEISGLANWLEERRVGNTPSFEDNDPFHGLTMCCGTAYEAMSIFL